MPEEARPAGDLFEAVAAAWEALNLANDALAAVNATGSREWSRAGMRVVRNRAQAFVAALEEVMKATAD